MTVLELNELGELDPASSLGRSWEALVKSTQSSGFMQSLLWAAFKRNQGLESLHLGLFENNSLVGGGLFYTPKRNKGAGFFVAPEGPILPFADEKKTSVGLRLIIDALEGKSGPYETMALRVEPRLVAPVPGQFQYFGRAPVDLIPRDTMYLDLARSDEAILAGMRPKGRYNIRLAAKHGVTVREDISPEAVDKFYAIMLQAGSRDGFLVEPKSFFIGLAQTLGPAGICHFLFAEHENDILAALLLITYGGRATYLYGGVSNHKRNLMAGYAVQWAAIQKAKELGATIYDFYGYDKFGSPRHGYARFSRFKKQFNGESIRFIGAHDHFFLDRLADAVVRAFNEVPNNEHSLSVIC